MSLTYEVAVPQGKWPSFAAMNAALAARLTEFIDKNIYNFTGLGPSAAPTGSS